MTVHTHTHTHKDSSRIILKQNKIFLLLITIFLLVLIQGTTFSKAALQANGNAATTDNIDGWLLNIRQMETIGGTLGLSETIDTTTLLSTSGSNNLDIHFEKNTEYGAMVILSASSYGKQTKVNDGETTTGNKSGVYMKINKEWTSSGSDTMNTAVSEKFRYVDSRYRDNYKENYVAKAGDAIKETAGWHGSTSSTWFNYDDYCSIVRSWSGSIFSYYGAQYNNGIDAQPRVKYASRAVIVVGEGL